MAETDQMKAPEAKIDINVRNDPDPILEDLVRLVEDTKAEIPITLLIGGILVSGMLVSHRSYLNYFGTEFEKVCQEKKIVSIIQAKCKEAEAASTSPGSEETPRKLRRHIHLKDAGYFVPGQIPIPHAGGTWWRGQLSEVDGFNIGTLRVAKEQTQQGQAQEP